MAKHTRISTILALGWGIALYFPASCLAQQSIGEGNSIRVERVFIKSLQEVNVPSLKTGLLAEVLCQEGSPVKAGDILARLQDDQAILNLEQAEAQADIARHLAESQLDLQTAEKKLEQAKQAIRQQELELQAADLQAANSLRAQAAEKNQAVAKNEFERAKQARANFADSVSESELDGLRLTFEKAGLDASQAIFEKDLDRLKAAAAAETRATLVLAMEAAQVEVAQAQSKLQVARFQAKLKEAELKAAQLHVEQHQLHCQQEGIVVDVYRQPGEWVEPGETVLRILRLDRLRAEAFVNIDAFNFPLENANAELEITVNRKPLRVFGKVTFVSPEIDPINRETTVWVEFDNPELLIKPGMHGKMQINASP